MPQLLQSEELVSQVIQVLKKKCVNSFSIIVQKEILCKLSSGLSVLEKLPNEVLEIRNTSIEIAEYFQGERLLKGNHNLFHMIPYQETKIIIQEHL